MEELELLKKDWQKKDTSLPKLSYDEIYNMLWKKSSSIVKWIFYISIIEFAFWIILAIIPNEGSLLAFSDYPIFREIEIALEIINYVVIIYFIYKFYKNYRKIRVTDSSSQLLKSIIDSRKTVMHYVWFNLGIFSILMLFYAVGIIMYDPENMGISEKVAQLDNQFVVILAFIIMLVAVLLVLGLFYRLLYGILLKRLNHNYKELKKLEV